MKKYRVITEHHTNEIHELFAEYKYSNNIIIKIFKYLRYRLEKKYQPLLLKYASGIIGVSNQVVNIHKEYLSEYKKSIAITNGISVDAIPFTKYKPFDNKNLDIAFIASSFAPWHGLERILFPVINFNGDINITLHIIGKIKKQYNHKNLIYHGLLDKGDYEKIMRNVHIGVASLALYKISISEISTLKVREYLSRGLPFITAYNDPDLSEQCKLNRYYIAFPNNDSPINLLEVIDFVKTLNKEDNVDDISNFMRNYAQKHIDWKIKMKQYVDFVESIHHNSKAGNLK